MFAISLRMNARVLSVLFESVGCEAGGAAGVPVARERARPFLRGGGTAPPPLERGKAVLFSAAIKCAMCYVACLQKHTRYKAHFVVHSVSSVSKEKDKKTNGCTQLLPL